MHGKRPVCVAADSLRQRNMGSRPLNCDCRLLDMARGGGDVRAAAARTRSWGILMRMDRSCRQILACVAPAPLCQIRDVTCRSFWLLTM